MPDPTATTPVIKARDVAYPRLQAPDLDVMEAFLSDFGLITQVRTEEALYLRAYGAAHHVHVVHRGPPAFLGFALEAESEEDLHRLATSPGFTPVEAIEGPGAGLRTTVRDPNGFAVEVVHGIERVAELHPGDPRPLNMGSRYERVGAPQRPGRGPSAVKRFGHLALNVADVQGSADWYNRHFGLLASDRVVTGSGRAAAIFARCDRGPAPADHHAILFATARASGGIVGLNHLSWEVQDIDAVHLGSRHLAERNRWHEWGVGRHLLGSQIFDYWRDPWGRIHEHWTDGDQFASDAPPADHGPEAALMSQWGPNPPPTFGRTLEPGEAPAVPAAS